jgi:ABC-type nitrate/sulfonate/bicarbonate transport system substrate-binding protein
MNVRWKEFEADVNAATALLRKSMDMAVGWIDATPLA